MTSTDMQMPLRLLLLMPSTTYRAQDFLDAARRLDVQVVVGSNHQQTLAKFTRDATLTLDFNRPDHSLTKITARAKSTPFAAIIGTDDETVHLAATAAVALNLPHNPPKAVHFTRDKHQFRQALARANLRSPAFTLITTAQDLPAAARATRYPCVLKPLALSASRGVIRANNAREFLAACPRIAAIVLGPDTAATQILVEDFIPGHEVALEGLLHNGQLTVLALFDKPDLLNGPFFEETIYTTPSRHRESDQREIITQTTAAIAALGLRDGPIHAELRIHQGQATLIELAARSIGGLCSRALGFNDQTTLEDLILRQALSLPALETNQPQPARGVMMIPIPAPGTLRAVTGLTTARAHPHIYGITLSTPIGAHMIPPPEGGRYLGFIFARAPTPAAAETALRRAHQTLRFDIEPP